MGKRRATPDVRERFGTAVKFRREELDMTQEELAARCGIFRTYLSRIENGTANPTLVVLVALADCLSVAVTEKRTKAEIDGLAAALGHRLATSQTAAAR